MSAAGGEAAPPSTELKAVRDIAPAGGERESDGTGWAVTMLAIELFEIAMLVEILFVDGDAVSSGGANRFLWIYFYLLIASSVVELAGIVLVKLGSYRLGGFLQIASSVPHVPKGDGIIGIIGGLKAWRFGQRREAAG